MKNNPKETSMSETNVTSESPFYQVLNAWGDELLEIKEDLDDKFSEATLGKSFTLKSGVQVRIEIGHNLLEED